MIVSVFLAQCAAFFTYALAQWRYFGAVRASAIVAIVGFFVLDHMACEVERYSAIVFGGTFIGMSAPKRFGFFTVVISALLFVLIFTAIEPATEGLGGALGVSAFIAVCLCHLGILLGAPRSERIQLWLCRHLPRRKIK